MTHSPLRVSVDWARMRWAAVHIALVVTALTAASFHVLNIHSRMERIALTDFPMFYLPALNLREGMDLYGSGPEPGAPAGSPEAAGRPGETIQNLNPPFQTVLFYPIGMLDIKTGYLAWGVFALASGLLGALLIPLGLGPLKSPVTVSLLALNLFLFYFPTFAALVQGQWSLVPFLFLALAWLSWRRGRVAVAGGILGGLAAIKLFFGAFLLFFVARREWRPAAAFCGVWLGCMAISVAITGPDVLIQYLGVFGEIHWYSSSWNASVTGFVTRALGEPGNEPLISAPRVASVLGILLQVAGVGLLVAMARRGASPSRDGVVGSLAFAGCVVLMLLISPLGWIYYFPYLLIPLLVVWKAAGRVDRGSRFRWLAVLAWLMSTVPRSLVSASQIGGDPALILGWSGAYFYALLMFLGLIWVLQSRLIEEEATEVVGTGSPGLSSS